MASIQRRGKRWRAQVRVGEVYRSETFSTKGAADAWAAKTEDAIRLGTLTESEVGGMTLGDAIGRYERERRAHKPLQRTARSNLRRWEESLGDRRLGSLTGADVLAHANGRGCSPATMAHELGALRGLLEAAEAWGLRIADPLVAALPALKRYGRIGKSKERDRRPSLDELRRLRDGFIGRRLPMADLMDFAIATAMRLGELVRIRWDDVNTADRLVLIRDRKDPEEKEGNDQWIPLLGDAPAIIERQPRTGSRIFPYHEDSIGRAWRDTCDRLGIEDLTWHDLRHEGTSRLFEAGYQIQEVALVTGHKDWKSLKRYTNLKPGSLHR